MKKTKIAILASIIICLAFSILTAKAASSPNVKRIASVNIEKGRIVSRDGNNFIVQFSLTNGQGVQPEVSFSINLARKGDKFDFIDSYTFPGTMFLGEGEKLTKQINFSAPAFLQGDYDMFLQVKNKDGVMLTNYLLGSVKLEGSGEYIEINPRNCNLYVGDSEEKFTLLQGVDLNKEEKLYVECLMKNLSGKQINFSPNFETNYRSEVGNNVATRPIGNQTDSLQPGEEKAVRFEVPQAMSSQAYHVTYRLLSDQGNKVSNSVILHYVVKGESATINNVKLDKDYYEKDENVNIAFTWSPSADQFPGSRHEGTDLNGVKATITVVDENQKECIAETVKNLDQNNYGKQEISSKALIDCENPNVSAEITDDEGNVLAIKSASIKSVSKRTGSIIERDEKGAIKDESTRRNLMILGVLFLGLVVLLLIYFMRNRKSSVMSVLAFMGLIQISLFAAGSVKKVNAETYQLTNQYQHLDSVTVNVDPSSLWDTALFGEAGTCDANYDSLPIFQPGEPINIKTDPFYFTTCGNFSVSLSEVKTYHDAMQNNLDQLGDSITYYAAPDCDTVHRVGFSISMQGKYIRGQSEGTNLPPTVIEEDFCYRTQCTEPTQAFQCVVASSVFDIEHFDPIVACGGNAGVGGALDPKVYIRGESQEFNGVNVCGDGFIASGFSCGGDDSCDDNSSLRDAIESEIDKDSSGTFERTVFQWHCQGGNIAAGQGSQDIQSAICTAYVEDTVNQTTINDLDIDGRCAVIEQGTTWQGNDKDFFCEFASDVELVADGSGLPIAEPGQGETIEWKCLGQNNGVDATCSFTQGTSVNIFE